MNKKQRQNTVFFLLFNLFKNNYIYTLTKAVFSGSIILELIVFCFKFMMKTSKK